MVDTTRTAPTGPAGFWMATARRVEGTGWQPRLTQDPTKLVLERHWPDRRLTIAVMSVELRGGKQWAHLSVSSGRAGRRERPQLPSWEELSAAKRDILGPSAKALMILPAAEEHFSIAEVLHLYQCLEPEGDGIPDMRDESGGL